MLEFWRRQAASLVPDPASAAGSNYDDCAESLGAVFELDPRRTSGWYKGGPALTPAGRTSG